jgi:methylenetetrahydrofolate reductase (NADPH)
LQQAKLDDELPMTKIAHAYVPGKFGLSFELFPPKAQSGDDELFRHVERLVEFKPNFITCTYGAGGSTRAKTLDIVSEVQRRFGCPVASHLTCVGSTVDELRGYLREASGRGIGNIVALRGDPPRGEAAFTPVEGGLRYANELVSLIHREFPEFGVAVAGYPETHREAPSPEADLDNLRRKVDAGAHAVITQLFYDNEDFWRFRDRCESVGIRVPIVPGILPVTNLAQIERIASLCGARLPRDFQAGLAQSAGNADDQFAVGVEFATRQVAALVERGVPGLHFYVLNKSPATTAVLRAIPRLAR